MTTKLKINGFDCLIRKTKYNVNDNSSHWYCGYVIIPEENILCGHDYTDKEFPELDVHGGITYARFEDDDWVIGFDCNHCQDSSDPFSPKHKPIEYVKAELVKLTDQLNRLQKVPVTHYKIVVVPPLDSIESPE
jgi:hypothetical protein